MPTMEISCRELGENCDFVARANSEAELFRKIEEHAMKVHGEKELTSELKDKIRKKMVRKAA